jgi:16S rRNA (cytosine1402-N4)-methyltransferase
MARTSLHETVLRQEAVAALSISPNGIYVDTTFGRGGHSSSILEELGPKGRLIVIDRDPEAIAIANSMQQQNSRLEVAHATFSHIEEIAESKGISGSIDGILFDLGVSSPQLDTAARGFSFMRDGPLDMRMNPGEGISAEQWINSAREKEIADVFFQFGEEKHSRRMARRIVAERKINRLSTTGQLAEIIKQANPAWEKDKHPATRAFQAIRIFINSEFDEIQQGLDQALSILKVGGRLVVISFHSLEDRIIKKFIAMQIKGDNFPRDLPVPAAMLNPRLKKVGKAVKPTAEEVEQNPRARSAVMRVAEKIA